MGIFDKFKEGLSKTRAFFNQGMQQIRQVFGGTDEELIEELEMLLLQADVGQTCTTKILDNFRQRLKREGRLDLTEQRRALAAAMEEVLPVDQPLQLRPGQLTILFMVGVNGTGKTTTCGKLALRYKQAGRRVMMAAADTFRAAAIEQLQHWAAQISVPCVAQAQGADPAAVVYDAIQAAKAQGTELLLIDTAGRLHNKQNLMAELGKMKRIILREAQGARVETLLLIDATTGQNALAQADAFRSIVDVTGLIISKLDGNAKGGVTLALAEHTGLPIYMAGLGEAAEDLIDFNRQAFVDSLLPDFQTLAS